MVTTVLILNVLIAAICWYITWHVWSLRRTLANVADALLSAEQSTHDVLHGAPEAIITAQKGSYQLRQSYERLNQQVARLQQILSLVAVGQLAWRRLRYPSSRRRTRSPRTR
ncbi:MAG: hypothetical protein IGR80_05885 [Synechococcales cyanobacterium K44_A2020_017]|nr:hypothetical protein [Synechococcales cyanobacterium K32_A2020_035]MBF2094272.1 hypothetical protein [Synechococcales cyanobacterium K44_A2020_017]